MTTASPSAPGARPRTDTERHFAGSVTQALLAYVRQRGGDDAVSRVLELACDERTEEELCDLAAWTDYAAGRRLFEAAVVALEDPLAPRHAGEELVGAPAGSELRTLFQSLGSPGELLRAIALLAPKYCTVAQMDAIEVTDRHAILSATSAAGFPRFPELCGFTAGLLNHAPEIFGFSHHRVVEEACETRGDSQCVFRVTWSGAQPADESAERARFLEVERAAMAARFDAFRSTAAELVSGQDVESVLACITERASSAVRAPRFVLAVRQTDGEPLRVHHQGFTPDEAAARAEALMVGERDDGDGTSLVVDVTSDRRHYGRLAACSEFGASFFEAERPLLAAYGRLAAAALDSATALEEARLHADRAEVLLSLARALAEAPTQEVMAERLAEAVPSVVDCDSAAVWLWDPGAEALRRAASVGMPEDVIERLSGLAIRPADTPELERMVTRPEPTFITRQTADVYLRGLLEVAGNVAGAIVPLRSGEDLLGIVSAAVASNPERLADTAEVVRRLQGVADTGAAALTNVRLVDQIRHQAMHDDLTGLANQRLLRERLSTALAEERRTGTAPALLLLDLDRFKGVNDTLGHAWGDRLLKAVADRLLTIARSEDTVARLGGDEFAILLRRSDGPASVLRVAERVQAALEAPFRMGRQQLFVTTSIGACLARGRAQRYDVLMKNADIAMYRVKGSGRNGYALFTPTTDGADPNTLRFEAQLRVAIDREELRIHYQPQVDLQTRGITGVEALVRWVHPELGLLGPDRFVPLAEELGLITDIDLWVLRTACRQMSEWAESGLPPVQLAVNLSERTLRHDALVDVVASVLSAHRLAPAQLELEVTERVVDAHVGVVRETLGHLHALGVRLAIDDFGTGSSGLTRLQRCPIDCVKIDKSFVSEITSADGRSPMVAAMLGLAAELGLTTVAEGVETAAQEAFLRRRGCDIAQGYGFARPVAATEMADLLEKGVLEGPADPATARVDPCPGPQP
ncbi:MAG: EAL domain-containing protein [Acidimicrobiia bacterium]|nr:EAL domain-containing protein [Acidimicrobiia bacterium]